MLARAVLVGSAPSAILLFETSFVIGPTERGCSLRKRRQACSSLNDLKNNAPLEDGPSYLGSPTAFGLAFTAPLRQETLGAAARQALAAASAYAGTKMAHLQTAEMCRSHGVQFTPLVAETTAAWEPHSAAF